MDEHGSSRSTEEQQALREIENMLESEDPESAATFVGSRVRRLVQQIGANGRRKLKIAAITTGLTALGVGIVATQPVVGVVGTVFVVLAANSLLGEDSVVERVASALGLGLGLGQDDTGSRSRTLPGRDQRSSAGVIRP